MAMKKSRIVLYLRFLKLFHAKRQPHKPAMSKSQGDLTISFFDGEAPLHLLPFYIFYSKGTSFLWCHFHIQFRLISVQNFLKVCLTKLTVKNCQVIAFMNKSLNSQGKTILQPLNTLSIAPSLLASIAKNRMFWVRFLFSFFFRFLS